MEHLRDVLPDAVAEAASGRWREPVADAARRQGHRARAAAGRARPGGPMTPRELVAAHGSPLWLVDLDRVRAAPARVPRRVGAAPGPTSRSPTRTRPTACRRSCSRSPTRAPRPRSCAHAEYALARDVVGAPGDTHRRQRPGQARRAAGARRRATARWSSSTTRAELRARRRRRRRAASGCACALPGVGDEPTPLRHPARRRARRRRARPRARPRGRGAGAHTSSRPASDGGGRRRALPGRAITVAWPPAGPERHVAAAARARRAGPRDSAWTRSTSAAAIPAAPGRGRARRGGRRTRCATPASAAA